MSKLNFVHTIVAVLLVIAAVTANFCTLAISAENVKLVKNLQYYDGADGDPNLQVLDVYIPVGVQGYPTVVFAHGGGWKSGKKGSDGPENFAETMAKNGIGCANINYRLSPEVKHPEHARDFARAVRFVRDNIAKYGGDPGKLFISGHSSGAQLAALIALDKRYLAEAGVPESAIRGAIPISAPLDLTRSDIEFVKWLKLDSVFEGDEALNDATAFNYVRKDAPPVLIFAAELESAYVINDAKALADALSQIGAHSEYRLIPHRTHGTILRRFGAKGDMTSELTIKFINRMSQ